MTKPLSKAVPVFLRRQQTVNPERSACDHNEIEHGSVKKLKHPERKSSLPKTDSGMIIVEVKKRLRLTPLFLTLIAFFAFTATISRASDHEAPAVRPATDFPAVETHPDENVSIAADPYDTSEKCSIFRVDYVKYNYIPIRLIVTNNGDKPISLVDARIHLITRDGDKIPAAKPDDIVRASTFDSKAGRTIPLPAPLPSIHGKAKTSTKNI